MHTRTVNLVLVRLPKRELHALWASMPELLLFSTHVFRRQCAAKQTCPSCMLAARSCKTHQPGISTCCLVIRCVRLCRTCTMGNQLNITLRCRNSMIFQETQRRTLLWHNPLTRLILLAKIVAGWNTTNSFSECIWAQVGVPFSTGQCPSELFLNTTNWDLGLCNLLVQRAKSHSPKRELGECATATKTGTVQSILLAFLWRSMNPKSNLVQTHEWNEHWAQTLLETSKLHSTHL